MVIEMVTKNQDHIILTAPVLIPDEPDCDYGRGEVPLSEKQVADIAHSFMQYGIIDKEHDYFSTKQTVAEPVESYILKEETVLKSFDGSTRSYPKGTWMLSSKVENPEIIEKVEKGEYTGYSGTFIPKDYAANMNNNASFKSSANLRIVDIENPVAYTVSIVKKPCVAGSKFCSISQKSRGNDMSNAESTLEKIKALVTKSDKEPKEPEFVTKADFEEFKKEQEDTLIKGFEMIAEKMAAPSKKPEDDEEEEEDSQSENNSSEEKDEKKENKPEDDEEDKPKQSSKSVQIHEQPPVAKKSETQIVYEAMGRDATGSKIHE